jgi:ribosomal protein L11 methyltransferase
VQWLEIKIVFESSHIELTVDLLAELFCSRGLKGVVVDDPFPDPVADWGADCVPPPERPAVAGYLPVDHRLEESRLQLEGDVQTLARRHPFRYTIEYRRIDEDDWAESWKAFFHPQKISATMVVKPTWREYTAMPNEKVIEIDPGMAFGTGTHPTTALCVQLLEKYLHAGRSVLDVGTGSGILLIVAAKLGAGRLTGVDADPVAVEVARKNLAQNRIGSQGVELHCGHLVNAVSRSHDLVVANILADVILELLDDVPGVLNPDGIFICSGIILSRRQHVADKMAGVGLTCLEVLEQDEWVALVGHRSS